MSTVALLDHRWLTTLAVTLRGPDAHRMAGRARRSLRTEVERLERTASRFRVDSELSRANAAAGRWVPVSPLLIELVEVGLAAAGATDGLVSPCLGRAVDAQGYRSWAAGEVPTLALSELGAADVDAWTHVEIGGGRLRVPAGVALDLGATAKAWLADQVAERIADETALDVVANMGGDLRAIALGPTPWVVDVDHQTPHAQSNPIEVFDAGLATSSQGGRRWRVGNKVVHHLIDPRTGASVLTPWWAASALAASATAANAGATAAMLLGEAAPAWLIGHELDAVLTEWDGDPAVHDRLQVIGRWPRGQEAA